MAQNIKLYDFERTTSAFNFVFEKDLEPGEKIYVRMPPVSSNKRGINDIGWIASGDVSLRGTLSRDPKNQNALWQDIKPYAEINKVTAFIEITNNDNKTARIEMRALFN